MKAIVPRQAISYLKEGHARGKVVTTLYATSSPPPTSCWVGAVLVYTLLKPYADRRIQAVKE